MIKFVYDENVSISSQDTGEPGVVRLGPGLAKLPGADQAAVLNHEVRLWKVLKKANKPVPSDETVSINEMVERICAQSPSSHPANRQDEWKWVLHNVGESTAKAALAYALKFPTNEIPRMLADLIKHEPSGATILNDPKFASWLRENKKNIQAYLMENAI